jgi:hypothetical protein
LAFLRSAQNDVSLVPIKMRKRAGLRMDRFLSLGPIMAFRSVRFPADRTFFEELFLDEELTDLVLQVGSAAFLFLGQRRWSNPACWNAIENSNRPFQRRRFARLRIYATGPPENRLYRCRPDRQLILINGDPSDVSIISNFPTNENRSKILEVAKPHGIALVVIPELAGATRRFEKATGTAVSYFQ